MYHRGGYRPGYRGGYRPQMNQGNRKSYQEGRPGLSHNQSSVQGSSNSNIQQPQQNSSAAAPGKTIVKPSK